MSCLHHLAWWDDQWTCSVGSGQGRWQDFYCGLGKERFGYCDCSTGYVCRICWDCWRWGMEKISGCLLWEVLILCRVDCLKSCIFCSSSTILSKSLVHCICLFISLLLLHIFTIPLAVPWWSVVKHRNFGHLRNSLETSANHVSSPKQPCSSPCHSKNSIHEGSTVVCALQGPIVQNSPFRQDMHQCMPSTLHELNRFRFAAVKH